MIELCLFRLRSSVIR